MRRFYWLVVCEGWRAYLARIKGGTRQVIAFLIQTAVLLGLIFFIPWFGNLQEEARLVAATVGAFLVSGLISFVWELFKAPVALLHNAESEVTALRTALMLEEEVEAVKSELLTHCQDGRAIFNRPEGFDDQTVETWKAEALLLLKKHYDINFIYEFEQETGWIPTRAKGLGDRFDRLIRVLENAALSWGSKAERRMQRFGFDRSKQRASDGE